MKRLHLVVLVLALSILACGQGESAATDNWTPRLALWLAQKDDLLSNPQAEFDLVMTAWFEPQEASALVSRHPDTNLLAGLSHTWIWDNAGWQEFLITIANQGNVNGPLQITEDMYLMFDDDRDGSLDRRCSPPGWADIYAMDPRHPKWRELILSFYRTVADQKQHSGVVVDMLDAYPFCEGARSLGVPTPLDVDGWISAQVELLAGIRESAPPEKWVFANAGRDFGEGSPFPKYLNGYLLENFLGAWGADLEEGLRSAERALKTTQPPHMVVFAVDTDDTGVVDWNRFRMGFAASLLLDNTYFAFDFGSRDHGSVTDWWFPEYYDINLGKPLGSYTFQDGNYRRDFERGVVVIAQDSAMQLEFETPHTDISTGMIASEFQVSQGDARIFISEDKP